MAQRCWRLFRSYSDPMQVDPEIDAAPEPPPRGVANRLAAILSRGFGLLSVACIVAMLVLTSVNVFGRYLFGSPVRGAEEIVGFLIVASVMFGAAEAHRRGEHICIDILEGAFPPWLRRVMAILAQIAVIVFSIVMAWTGWETVAFSRAFGNYSPGYTETPMWIVQLPLVIGGVLLAVIAALKLIAGLRGEP
jgi:TRAP-type C4-dicarboxylate transport system permease small subunit